MVMRTVSYNLNLDHGIEVIDVDFRRIYDVQDSHHRDVQHFVCATCVNS